MLLLMMMQPILVLLLLVRPSQACPAQYNVCEAWTNISSFPIHSMVGVHSLEYAHPNECRLLGLQTTYIPGIKYTFAVVSDYIVARKVYASAGQIIGSSRTGINTSPAAVAAVETYNDKSTKEHDHSSHAHRRRSRRRNLLTSDDIASVDTTASCFDCGRPTHGSVLFDWIAPAKGIGKVTFVAMCGGSSQGNGAAGFVKISGQHSADETYAHSSPHTCVPSVVRALDEYALSGLQASDAAAIAAAGGGGAAADGGHASGGHSGTFSSFDALAGGNLSILFASWEVSTTGGYVAVLLGCFAAGVAVRLLRIPLGQLAKGVREDSGDNVEVDNFCSKKNICSLVLLFLSFFVLQSLGYFLMLLTMLFDVGLFVSITLGLSSGYLGETWWRHRQKSGGGGDVTTIEMKGRGEDSEVYGDCCDVDA